MSKRIDHYYNFHNILTMRISRQKRFVLIPDINLRFSYFETETINDPDLIINIGKFVPANTNCTLVDHKYFIKEDYIYCKESEGIASWEFEIIGLNSKKTIINFNSRIFGLHEIVYPDILAQNLIGRSIIEYKMSQKGYYPIHAGAIAKDNKAFIFAGRGGANKSSVVMNLIRNEGFQLLGDDWIIIKDKKVYSLPTHFLEFNFKAKVLPDEHMRGLADRINLIKYLRKKHNYKEMPVKVKDTCSIDSIFLLLKGVGCNLDISKISSELSGKRLYFNNYIEETQTSMSMGLVLQGFMKYFIAYSFVFPDNPLKIYWENFAKEMSKLTKSFDIKEITVPAKYSEHVTYELSNLVLNRLK